MKKVSDYMTREPVTIGRAQTASRALELMRQHDVRHLPVLYEGDLCGLISLRELSLVEQLEDVVPELILVDAVMAREPLSATPDESLAVVADRMADQKAGSAVVIEGGRVVGILTTIDTLHALADALRGQDERAEVAMPVRQATL